MEWMQRAVARRHSAEEGLTLIELLIVILILGVLATIVVLGVSAFQGTGEESACETSAGAAEAAWAGYYAKNGAPPAGLSDLTGGTPPYLVEKGKSYAFTFNADGQVSNVAAICGT
jgi:prepilin-type N-terminal cleavage/methylation domain-containing protein